MITLFVLAIFGSSLRYYDSAQYLTSEATRMISYDDRIRGHALIGHEIANKKAPSIGVCSQMCSKSHKCLSFNYQESPIKLCTLNSRDRFTDPDALSTDLTATYYGMKSDRVPECRQEGVEDDSISALCGIANKKIDCYWAEWGEWGEWQVPDGFNTIRSRHRKQVGPYHGGNPCDTGGTSEHMYLGNLYYVTQHLTWSEARANCNEQLAGHLVDPGNVTELARINKYGWDAFWTGWSCWNTGQCQSTYINDLNDPEPRTILTSNNAWREGQPDFASNIEYCVGGYHRVWGEDFINDDNCNYAYFSICEL